MNDHNKVDMPAGLSPEGQAVWRKHSETMQAVQRMYLQIASEHDASSFEHVSLFIATCSQHAAAIMNEAENAARCRQGIDQSN